MMVWWCDDVMMWWCDDDDDGDDDDDDDDDDCDDLMLMMMMMMITHAVHDGMPRWSLKSKTCCSQEGNNLIDSNFGVPDRFRRW